MHNICYKKYLSKSTITDLKKYSKKSTNTQKKTQTQITVTSEYVIRYFVTFF